MADSIKSKPTKHSIHIQHISYGMRANSTNIYAAYRKYYRRINADCLHLKLVFLICEDVNIETQHPSITSPRIARKTCNILYKRIIAKITESFDTAFSATLIHLFDVIKL
eukprot:276252_1